MDRPTASTLSRSALATLILGAAVSAQTPGDGGRSASVRALDGRVLSLQETRGDDPRGMLVRDARARLREANLRENRAWAAVTTRADWDAFRSPRLRALRESLGTLPEATAAPRLLVTGSLEGDGYRVENLVYESRPGLVVTANLYLPARPARPSPAILIAHSHHNPRTQGELQDMGMTWARRGNPVLVPDMLGHGERRQHPFRTPDDDPRPFRVGRQDYYFRSNSGVQLALVGESLMGWMVGDLMRSLDVLRSRPEVDPDRLIVVGSVAGGGDPAGVLAALDDRVAAVVPFNFGGPQPDYAVPEDAERDFYFFGVPYWESTRCLRSGARDGFAHWLIVGSVAPRGLVYAHEFAWDRDRDPAWPRLLRVFSLCDAEDRLAVATGRGSLKGTPPESSHCNNIGPLHREGIYAALERWFGMPVPEEFSDRRPVEELLALTPEAVHQFRPRPLHELAGEVGVARVSEARRRLATLPAEERIGRLRRDWARLLGDVAPEDDPQVVREMSEVTPAGRVERFVLRVSDEVVLPVVLLTPEPRPAGRPPVVLALAPEGKETLLSRRAEAIAGWLDGGAAVCLVDVRGTGATRPPDDSRRYNGAVTTRSATEWLLGQTLLGARLRDVRSVLRHLRARDDLDAARVAVWGDSFAPANPEDARLAAPLDAEPFPRIAEPTGGLLALLTALFEDDVRVVSARGGLSSYQSLLESPFLYVPHDALVPGALTAGDLGDVAAALAPRPLWLQGMVDGLNREVPPEHAKASFEPARSAYSALGADDRLRIEPGEDDVRPAARWLLARLVGRPEDPAGADAERPSRVVPLFNGEDLDGLTTWLRDEGHDDPRRVFRVEDGVLRITGDGFGYVGTRRSYRDYRLVVEYRWGEKTDGGAFVRNSGVLLHAVGPDGNARGTWMASVECQLAQGCVGDLIPISGAGADGDPLPVRFTSPVVLGPDGRPRWSDDGEPREFTRGQLWWSRHDPEFQELLDTRGRFDVESPKGEWTRVECTCRGDKITVAVNGQVVNRCEGVSPASGRILLQSEGFELFIRRFELHPLDP